MDINGFGMNIVKIETGKRRFLRLLLVGDESEAMIDKYHDKGDLYVGFIDNTPIAVCVTVHIDMNMVEIKNLAVLSTYRCQGFGRKMLEYVESLYPGKTFTLGTGETPSTLRFYKSCGYSYSHRLHDFFVNNYPNPSIEENVTLRDMIYLKKTLGFNQ